MRDLSEVLDLTLKLPIGGKVYVVQPPSAANGVDLMNRLAFGIAADAGIPLEEAQRRALVVDDDAMPDFARQCIGDTLDEMTADGVAGPHIEFAVTTAFYAWTVGKEYAEHYWESAGNPGRPAEKRRERPTATPTREAAASGSPTSASPSGMTARSPQPDPRGSRSSSSGATTATSSRPTSTSTTASTSTSPRR